MKDSLTYIQYGAYFLQLMIFGSFFQRCLCARFKPRVSFLLYLLLSSIGTFYFLGLLAAYSFLRFAVVTAILFFAVCICYKDSWTWKLFVVFSIIVLGLLGEFAFSVLHFLVFKYEFPITQNTFIYIVWSMLSLGWLLLCATVAGIFIQKKIRPLRSSLTTKKILVFLLCPASQAVFIVYCIFCVVFNPRIPYSFVFSGLSFFVILEIILYLFVVKTSQTCMLQLQLAEAKFTAAIQAEEYQSVLEIDRKVSRYRHDQKNQLLALRSILRSEDSSSFQSALEFLDEMISAVPEESQVFCPNNVVNAILRVKKSECESHSIVLQHTLLIPAQLPIRNIDLCSVFSNVLDNAIRACTVLPPAQRVIELCASIDCGILFIRAENPLPKAAVPKGKGLGTLILKQIAQTYNGEFLVEKTDTVFRVLMALPLDCTESSYSCQNQ